MRDIQRSTMSQQLVHDPERTLGVDCLVFLAASLCVQSQKLSSLQPIGICDEGTAYWWCTLVKTDGLLPSAYPYDCPSTCLNH